MYFFKFSLQYLYDQFTEFPLKMKVFYVDLPVNKK